MRFTVIDDPLTFFHLLRSKVKTANNRIVLSALYLGIDKEALQLIEDLRNAALDSSRPNLDIQLILDYSRTMRSPTEYKTCIGPMCDTGISIHLYQMPQYQSWLRNSLNEILGVYHIKFFLFDDEVILSGANLNGEYFRDRQDRYISVKDDVFVNWFIRLKETLTPFCYRVNADMSLHAPKKIDNRVLNQELLALSSAGPIEMSGAVDTSISGGNSSSSNSDSFPISENKSTQSFAMPIIQFARIGILTESIVLPRLMKALVGYIEQLRKAPTSENSSSSIVISSPYPSYSSTLLSPLAAYLTPSDAQLPTVCTSDTQCLSFIMPASSSHGFHRGAGFKAWIPLLHQDTFYRSLHRADFFSATTCDTLIDNAVSDNTISSHIITTSSIESKSTSHSSPSSSSGASTALQLCEYGREGWTYHAKGIWVFLPHSVDIGQQFTNGRMRTIDSIKKLFNSDYNSSSSTGSKKSTEAVNSLISQFSCVSYIGSSNLGSRSWGRDFELGFVLLSRDPVVHRQLRGECDRIQTHCRTLQLVPHKSTVSGVVGMQSYTAAFKHQWKRVAITSLAWGIHTFL